MFYHVFFVPAEKRVRACSKKIPFQESLAGVWHHPDAVPLDPGAENSNYLCPHCGQIIVKSKIDPPKVDIRSLSVVTPLTQQASEVVARRRLGYAGCATASIAFLIHALGTDKVSLAREIAIACFSVGIPLLVSAVLILEGQINQRFHTANADHWVGVQAFPGMVLSAAGIAVTIADASLIAAVAFVVFSMISMILLSSASSEELDLIDAGITYESLKEQHRQDLAAKSGEVSSREPQLPD